MRATSAAVAAWSRSAARAQQVHVRVQRQRQRDDRAGERADLREPGVAAELVAPPRLDRAGDAEHRGGDEAEDVARHRERQHERPADSTPPAGEPVGADEPRQARRRAPPRRSPRRPSARRRDDLVGQPGLPLLAPDRACSGAARSWPAWRSGSIASTATTTGAATQPRPAEAPQLPAIAASRSSRCPWRAPRRR